MPKKTKRTDTQYRKVFRLVVTKLAEATRDDDVTALARVALQAADSIMKDRPSFDWEEIEERVAQLEQAVASLKNNFMQLHNPPTPLGAPRGL
jgi:hypothetical protein